MGSDAFDEFFKSLPPAFDLRLQRIPDTLLAKTIRQELALAVTRGVLPEGTEVSVRQNKGGHTCSLTAEIVRWGGAVYCPAYEESLMGGAVWDEAKHRCWVAGRNTFVDGRLVPALSEALWAIERIASRHNYDRSDTMTDYFDVGYYLHVEASTVERAAQRGIRLQFDQKFMALCADAHRAAESLGAKVVRSVCGKHGLETASEHSMARLVRMAERAKGRPVVYDKRKGWVVQPERAADTVRISGITLASGGVSHVSHGYIENAKQPIPVPRRVVADDTLYITDNGRILCGAHCGMSAAYTGRDISGQPIRAVFDDAADDWIAEVGEPIQCEQCGKSHRKGA